MSNAACRFRWLMDFARPCHACPFQQLFFFILFHAGITIGAAYSGCLSTSEGNVTTAEYGESCF